jgi:hypothetical protein
MILSHNVAHVYWRPPNIYHDRGPQPTREQYSERPTTDPRQTLSTELQTQASGQLNLRLAPVMHRHQELPLVPDEVGVTPTSVTTGPLSRPRAATSSRAASRATNNRCSSTSLASLEDMTEDLQPLSGGQPSFRVEPAMRRSQESPLVSDDVGVAPTSPATHTCRPTQSI